MKKKILYLSQLYPYPPDGGGKIKTLNTLKTLSKKYQIYAIFISEEKPAKKDLYELTKLGIKIKIFYSDRILSSVKDDLKGLFWNFLHGIPHYVFQYTYKPAIPFIKKSISKFKPDIIHIDHLNMAQYLPKEKQEIWILEHHNVEFYLYWTRFFHSYKFTRKCYLFIEMLLTYLFEKKTLKKFDHIFAISDIEKRRVQKFFHLKNISTQPFMFKPLKIHHKINKYPFILFIGNLGWPPNEDTIEWFLKEIFPLVIKKIPQVQFHVVGKRQPMYEKNWPKPKNLVLHGFKKSLTPFLKKAHVFVMPFRMGGGMRIKSLTALSAGLPLVSTSLGIEGLHVVDKQDFILANKPQSFAKAVIKVLKNKKLQKNLSKNAIGYIKKYHGQNGNKEFLQKYQEINIS